MASAKIFIDTTNLFVIEGVEDTLGLLSFAELNNTDGRVTLYTDAAHTVTVPDAISLVISPRAGQSVAPLDYFAIIPSTVTLVRGTTYFAVGFLTATDIDLSVVSKITFEEIAVAEFKS